jgi:hypothetical protein
VPDKPDLNPNLNLSPSVPRESALRTRTWSEKVRAEEPQAPSADPNVRQLQEQSGEFNARVHDALGSIPVPPDLRERILAQQKIITVPLWRKPQTAKALSALALAAAIALLATGLVFWNRAPTEDKTFAGFQARMVGFALRQYDMDLHTNELGAVKSYLAAKGAPADFPLPPTLASTPVKGGKSLLWQGKPVGMVCFDVGNETLYMFVIDSPVPGTPTNAASPPHLETYKNLATATWSFGNKTFLLAGRIPVLDLERLV